MLAAPTAVASTVDVILISGYPFILLFWSVFTFYSKEEELPVDFPADGKKFVILAVINIFGSFLDFISNS
jgi:hypothetical protein